jgi:hypothetical protein
MNVIFDRIPPQEQDIERKILASILYDRTGGLLNKALAELVPDDFYHTQHHLVFCALRDTKSIEPEILLHSMNGAGDDSMKALIETLMEYVASSPTIDALVKILKDCSGKRATIINTERLIQECYERSDIPARDLMGSFTAQQERAFDLKPVDAIPPIVWGAHYTEHGIPERKPELIGGILRQSHKMLIGAPSKACKSFLAIRLALAIANGKEWLPGFQCKQGKVYVGNFEVDDGSYIHRVQAVADALQWAMPDNIAYHHLRGYSRNIEELLPAISAAIEGHEFSAVILDPQYKLLRSSEIRNFSENDAAAMAYLYGELDRHFSRNNISPIMISHFAKGSAAGKDSIDRIVGSGAPMRDVDAICTLTALDSPDAYTMEFSLREFKAPEPLSLQWKYPIHTPDTMLDAVPLKKPGGRPGVDRSNDDAAVLQIVQGLNGKATQSAVRAALAGQMNRYRVVDALERLIVSCKLTVSKGEKNAKIYHPK